MLKNKICVELNNSLKEIQQMLINTIESPVRGDYNICMRHKKIQNNIIFLSFPVSFTFPLKQEFSKILTRKI